VHQDVEPVWQVLDQLACGIFGADIQGHRACIQACGQGFKVGLGLGHIEQNDLGAVAGQGFGDGGTDASSGAGHQRLAPGQGARPVLHRCVAS